jgi:hypothetical protein
MRKRADRVNFVLSEMELDKDSESNGAAVTPDQDTYKANHAVGDGWWLVAIPPIVCEQHGYRS